MQISGPLVVDNPPQIGIGSWPGFSGFGVSLFDQMVVSLAQNSVPRLINHPVLAQHLVTLERDPELYVSPVKGLACGLQICPSHQIETVLLRHPRKIVCDPLTLEGCILRPALHPCDDNRRTDPGSAQRGIHLRPNLRVL